MARKSGQVSAAEAKRRKAQSQRDKSGNKQPVPSGPGKAGSKSSGSRTRKRSRGVGGKKDGALDYTKLILDPCNAKLTPTPLPGREGSSMFRLPFRFVVTLNNGNTNFNGQTITPSGTGNQSNGTCTAFTALLTPHAMSASSTAAYTITCVSAFNESGTLAADSAYDNPSNYVVVQDPLGLNQLDTMSSMIRPVAGCIKAQYYSGGANTGTVIGYEGPVGQFFHHYASTASPSPGTFMPSVNVSQLAMLGWSSPIVTQGVEACVNIAAAPQQWQEFRSLSGIYQGTANTGAVGNPDAGDTDFSQMPVAAVAVGGGTPGTQYLISGAVVYEWVPTISLGLGPSADSFRPKARSQTIIDKVASQLSTYGPMLVGAAARLATGGPSLVLSDLLYRLSLSSGANQVSDVPRIGWK